MENYRLLVTFDNQERRIFDVKPYLTDTFFSALSNPYVFNTVHVNPLTVGWSNDIAPEELYLDSIPV
jgi:hypothetical protein